MRLVRLLGFAIRKIIYFYVHEKLYTEEEFGVKGRKGSCSFSILSTLWDSFLIIARMDFAAEHTKRDDGRAPLVNASVNV